MADPIILNYLFLFKFSETVGIKAFLGLFFQRTGLVEDRMSLQVEVRINGKRADINKAPRLSNSNKSVQQISGGEGRIHERAGKGFIKSSGQMINYTNVFSCLLTVGPIE